MFFSALRFYGRIVEEKPESAAKESAPDLFLFENMV